jgi:ribosomal protein L19E
LKNLPEDLTALKNKNKQLAAENKNIIKTIVKLNPKQAEDIKDKNEKFQKISDLIENGNLPAEAKVRISKTIFGFQ